MRIKQEKIENDFQKGERFIDSEGEDDDVYSTEGVEQEMEEDEISPEEAGLMEGYDNIKSLRCKMCKTPVDSDKIIEKVTDDGEEIVFCSKKCAKKFEKG